MTETKQSNNLQDTLGERPDKPKLETTVTERKITGDSEENRMVREVGRRLKPEGFEHVGSYCVHVYKPKFGLGVEFRSQNLEGSDKTQATAVEANMALQQLSIAVAKSYGWKPGRRQSKLIKEL